MLEVFNLNTSAIISVVALFLFGYLAGYFHCLATLADISRRNARNGLATIIMPDGEITERKDVLS